MKMLVSLWIALQLWILSALCADCNLTRVPKPKQAICNKRGTLPADYVPTQGQIRAKNETDCYAQGYYYSNSFSWAYNQATGICGFNGDRISNLGFTADKSGDYIVADFKCYKRTGFCPVQNPSLENIPKQAKPKGPSNKRPDLRLFPFATRSQGINSYARLGRNSELAPNSQTPDGNNFIFTSISNKDGGVSVIQSLTYDPSTTYTLSFSYNFLLAKTDDDTFTMNIDLKRSGNSGDIGTISFDALTEADAQWHQYTSPPFTTQKVSPGYQNLAVALYITDGTSSEDSAKFLVDNIVVTPVTAT